MRITVGILVRASTLPSLSHHGRMLFCSVPMRLNGNSNIKRPCYLSFREDALNDLGVACVPGGASTLRSGHNWVIYQNEPSKYQNVIRWTE